MLVKTQVYTKLIKEFNGLYTDPYKFIKTMINSDLRQKVREFNKDAVKFYLTQTPEQVTFWGEYDGIPIEAGIDLCDVIIRFKPADAPAYEINFNDYLFSMTQEHGIASLYDIGSELPTLMTNGQTRINIKLWKGCSNFDSFQART
jgi:hypothetical protein